MPAIELTDSGARFVSNSEVDVSITAISTSETTFLDLSTSGKHYILDDVTLKCSDPGSDTVSVRLYKSVNGTLANIKTKVIATPASVYYSIADLFGGSIIAGDSIRITVQSSANSYAVTGEYSYRSA